MNLKAQALLNAATVLEREYGRDALAEVLRRCSQAVRDRYVAAIAINWHPLDELVEFLEVAERVTRDPTFAERAGAEGARANTRGVLLQTALLLAKPEQVLARAASLWRRYNDEGELVMDRFERGAAWIAIVGIPASRPFCATITGWARELVTSAGGKEPTAKHVSCRVDGAERCVWLSRWKVD